MKLIKFIKMSLKDLR